MPPDAPPAQPPGGDGFGVVAEQLRTLADYFEDLEDAADGFQRRVGELASITGEQTGRCCRQAGDTLGRGLGVVGDKLAAFGTAALDVRDALADTARNYEQADAGGANQLYTAGTDL